MSHGCGVVFANYYARGEWTGCERVTPERAREMAAEQRAMNLRSARRADSNRKRHGRRADSPNARGQAQPLTATVPDRKNA